jgi:hypothetical protein
VKRSLVLLFVAGLLTAQASDLDTIGATLLRQVDPALNGTGIPVAQVESPGASNDFEVNPAVTGHAQSLFTWISINGTASAFPNSVGSESGHANGVGVNFYGTSGGAAPGISHVDNYEANHYYNAIIAGAASTTTRVVNQSFIFGGQIAAVDQNYDDYAAQFNTIFLSGAGNFGAVSSPGTSYNGLDVGVYGASSSFGPTTDGRCKPDITAPGGATSFSTPYVSGAAAILVQAAARGDGVASPSLAGEARTIKALLLNGAVKPADWTNSPSHPLDLRYGAGILNVFNSWKQLTGGKHAFIEATSHPLGASHPPGTATNNTTLSGWDLNSITNNRSGHSYEDRVHHYYINVPASLGSSFTLTATLVWNRATGQSSIRNLDLFLYNASTGSLVTSSTSDVDNVEHLFETKLPAGRYDLQVVKSAEAVTAGTSTETYALAYEAFSIRLDLVRSASGLTLSWPISPSGFLLQTTTNLTGAAWNNVTGSIVVSNSQNFVAVSATNAQRFFRLQRP